MINFLVGFARQLKCVIKVEEAKSFGALRLAAALNKIYLLGTRRLALELLMDL